LKSNPELSPDRRPREDLLLEMAVISCIEVGIKIFVLGRATRLRDRETDGSKAMQSVESVGLEEIRLVTGPFSLRNCATLIGWKTEREKLENCGADTWTSTHLRRKLANESASVSSSELIRTFGNFIGWLQSGHWTNSNGKSSRLLHAFAHSLSLKLHFLSPVLGVVMHLRRG
jgi:hypothetical protein